MYKWDILKSQINRCRYKNVDKIDTHHIISDSSKKYFNLFLKYSTIWITMSQNWQISISKLERLIDTFHQHCPFISFEFLILQKFPKNFQLWTAKNSIQIARISKSLWEFFVQKFVYRNTCYSKPWWSSVCVCVSISVRMCVRSCVRVVWQQCI